ncbi:DUF4012 domain-containing protein [Herbiconiux liangxiaofengii]|uniref:DUF4012 domain-containing protein n=1 Tax=Herbiconiux liangxiaofengii TaxID=3342795 RepID=UPI0035BB4FF7
MGLFVAVVAVAAWVGIRGYLAAGELQAAVPLASKVQSQVADGEIEAAKTSAAALVDHSRSAHELTGDPIWRVSELVPWVGGNLRAVREAAEVTDTVAREAVFPLVSDVAELGADSFKPVNGVIDLGPIVAAQPTVSSARIALNGAAAQARSIDVSETIDPISDAVDQLTTSVDRADTLIEGVDRAVTLLPRMLGADGARTYLLLFQNPAELRAGGGITSALAEISTNAGSVSLARQASGGDFRGIEAPVVQLPAETLDLYGDRAARYVQNTTLVPDFATSGQIAATMWANEYGTQVDGVLSIDPVALSYLLEATGPITLPATGEVLTAQNAVQFLLSDVYAKYQEPSAQDAVFAESAKAVFDTIAGGSIDPIKLLDALGKAGGEDRLKVWSSHPDDQAVLVDTTLAGGLPVNSDDATGVGVYFNDATGAKMDYYLDTAVQTATAVCRADGRMSIAVSVTLTNTAPADAGATLPRYVTGGGAFRVTPGNVSTIVYIYAPSNPNPDEPTLVTNLDPGVDGGSLFSARDGLHTVTGFSVDLAPGESRTVSVDLVAQSGLSSQIDALITPTIKPTVYSTETNRSFSEC